jgi:hypothetical protein
MVSKKLYFMVLVIGILFCSGCANIPGLPKFVLKNQSSSTTFHASTTTSTLDAGSNTCPGGECCRDDNKNGICDIDESASMAMTTTLPEQTTSTTKASTTTSSLVSATTTLPEATTTQTTAATTTTVANTSTPGAKQCSVTSDCGESYIGGCTCTGSDIKRVRYIPTCRNGTCMFLSKPETITCKDIETTDETVISEKCVPGYGVCITKDAVENYLKTPSKARIAEKLSSTAFSGEYYGYRFKLDSMAYVGETRCFDSMKFYISAMTPTGLPKPAELAWNTTMSNNDIKIGIDNIRIGSNGSAELSIWVLKK